MRNLKNSTNSTLDEVVDVDDAGVVLDVVGPELAGVELEGGTDELDELDELDEPAGAEVDDEAVCADRAATGGATGRQRSLPCSTRAKYGGATSCGVGGKGAATRTRVAAFSGSSKHTTCVRS
jgi:hypothetical protein